MVKTEIRDPSDNELLADFVRPWGPRVPSAEAASDEIAASFDSMSAALSTVSEAGLVQVTLRDSDTESAWSFDLGDDECRAAPVGSDSPDLEIITHRETWVSLVRGELTPLAAFTGGELRLRGRLALARALSRGMADSAQPTR